ncbi:hypothetical protein [Pseudoalteromonas rhizosphaerae]|uniref:Uncharacterized protein n=1 Tax=Pseudoalteromonas rhizosphaerae TaxID=2518973 RepID=A0ABW8L2G4_9GAMM
MHLVLNKDKTLESSKVLKLVKSEIDKLVDAKWLECAELKKVFATRFIKTEYFEPDEIDIALDQNQLSDHDRANYEAQLYVYKGELLECRGIIDTYAEITRNNESLKGLLDSQYEAIQQKVYILKGKIKAFNMLLQN